MRPGTTRQNPHRRRTRSRVQPNQRVAHVPTNVGRAPGPSPTSEPVPSLAPSNSHAYSTATKSTPLDATTSHRPTNPERLPTSRPPLTRRLPDPGAQHVRPGRTHRSPRPPADPLPDPVLCALRRELLNQTSEMLRALSNRLWAVLVRKVFSLRAVFVGVAEDANDVEAGRDQEAVPVPRSHPRSHQGIPRSRSTGSRPAVRALGSRRSIRGSCRRRRSAASAAAPAHWRAGRTGRSTAATPGVFAITSMRSGTHLGRLQVADPHPVDAVDRGKARQQALQAAAGHRGPCRRRSSSR